MQELCDNIKRPNLQIIGTEEEGVKPKSQMTVNNKQTRSEKETPLGILYSKN
jgi:hypothetical protein